VIHAAAYTKVDAAESDPEGARLLNEEATKTLARAAAEAGAILVYPSTDYVFPGDASAPYREDDPTGPLSVYGATKLAGERAASTAPEHVIVRTSWVYGDGANFVRTILRVATGRPELAVVDDQRGRPTYAPDLARGILSLLGAGARGTFHLAGGGDPATWADLAEAALEVAGLSTMVRRVTTAEYYAARSQGIARRPLMSVLDCSRAAALGVELRPWRDAVAEYVREVA
jgi:dTDP-4-dehydrorhamnose 3,5-epimerase